MSKGSYLKNRILDIDGRLLNLARRYRIIEAEIVGPGAFLLLIMVLQMIESNWNQVMEEFAWVYAIIGITLLLVGLETLSLNRRLPTQ